MSMGALDWRRPYLAGIIDNHAGLVVTVGKDGKRRVGFRIGIECRVKLSSQRSARLVMEFLDEFEITYREDMDRETTYETVELVIGRRGDIQTLLRQLDDFLVARDAAAERLSETIIPMLEEGAHQEQESFLELLAHIERFREEVGRANRAKYDREYFESEWEQSVPSVE